MTRDELQRLIDTIVAELMPAVAHAPQGRCACHSVLDDCCPDRLRGVLDAGASRVGMYAGGGAPVGVAAMIDHTLLKPDATRADIEALCREAAQFKFATVCVNPTWVALAAKLLAGSGVGVCSVVGFPLGATTARRQGLRDAPRHLRRRARNRHGDQRRRAQVRRLARGRVRSSRP